MANQWNLAIGWAREKLSSHQPIIVFMSHMREIRASVSRSINVGHGACVNILLTCSLMAPIHSCIREADTVAIMIMKQAKSGVLKTPTDDVSLPKEGSRRKGYPVVLQCRRRNYD